MNKYLVILLLPFVLLAQSDRVIGVVDREAITLGEVDEKLGLSGIPITQDMRSRILTSIIDTKLLTLAAERETLSVSEEDIENALNNTINSLKSNFPNEEVFYAELKNLNMTENDLKKIYREEVKGNLFIRALIQKKFGNLSVSDIEALHFYNKYPDSIPDIPASAKYTSVLIPIIPNEKLLKEKEGIIKDVSNKILAGEDFEKLVDRYSEDSITKQNKGRLGVINIDDIEPQVRIQIEDMIEGDVRIVQMKNTVHIMNCDARTTNTISLRTIVFYFIPAKEDTSSAYKLAEGLKKSIEENNLQIENERAIIISDGADYLPILPIFENININTTQTVESTDGIYVVKIIDKKEARHPEFEEIRDNLKAFLLQRKTEGKLIPLLSQLKEEIFVDIRL